MKDSEILRELISLAFDSNPGDTKITLTDALDLYGRLVIHDYEQTKALVILPKPEDLAPFVAKTEPAKKPKPIEEPSENQVQTPPGRGGKFKAEVLQRLKEYRKANGLGSLTPLAEATNGALSEHEVREMMDAIPYPLAKWKVLDAALAFLEGKESGRDEE